LLAGLASGVEKVSSEVQIAEAQGSSEELIRNMQQEVLRAWDNVSSMEEAER
jgi:hypothetical protein